MKKYKSMPRELVSGWATRDVHHSPSQAVDLHYHEVEEWLEILEGQISFFSAGEREYALAVGEALRIPRGEVHHVQIGVEGVTYRMWLPVDLSPDRFTRILDAGTTDLIKRNLKLPVIENDWDKKKLGDIVTGDPQEFLNELISSDLFFRTAAGSFLVGKRAYLNREAAQTRRIADDSIIVLDKRDSSLLISTVVYVQSEDSQQSFANLRLFVQEGGFWRCRIWMNYPELATSYHVS